MAGPRRSRAPELWVLALGLAAAVALGWAALLPAQDPETAARAELAALAGEVEDAVRGEWARVLRELPERVADAGPALRWGDAPAAVEPVELDLASAPVAWRALLLDADDAREAPRGLELARLAEARSESAAQRAEALLRVAQRAARVPDGAGARAAWTAAQAEVPGAAARGGISLRLATFLAAAPALDPIERARGAADLALAWSRGELALPVAAAPGGLDERVALLAERLARAADPSGAGPEPSVQKLLDRALERLRAASLERTQGPLPARPEGSAWRIARRGEILLAWSAADGSGCAGLLLSDAALAAALAAAAAPLLPAGFRLDVAGDGPGDLLRPRVELVPGALGFTLRHADARAWIAAGSTRARWMRWGLGALALLCGVAGVVTARALGRQRHLAELQSAFVAGVSHELRTPVASILLLAENLEQGRVADEAGRARYHGLIRREAQRLRRLVDGVLDFSRVERGRGIELAREDVDVPAWLASVREEALEWARQHGMELDVALSELPPSARIDREALRRALWNLLENAHRHSGSNAVVLRARGAGPALVLEVEDRGRGVPAARRAAVFEPFTRFAEAGTAGAGLGLALVREIARAHGGTIALAEGADGTGARFTLRVPIEAEEDSVSAPTRVLVVEDEDPLRLALCDALRGEGFEVLEAADGEEGLALALREGPELVLLDLMLPKRDGFSVLRAIRQDRLASAVVILSARGEEWDRVQGFEYGADDYVVKPFSTRELVLRLRAVLRRAEGEAPGVATPERKARFGACEVDFAAYTVTRGGERQGLSRRELDLLRVLLERPGKVLSREELLDLAWGRDEFPTTRTVDMHVLKLRKKIEPDPESPRHIVTVHGVGYRFER